MIREIVRIRNLTRLLAPLSFTSFSTNVEANNLTIIPILFTAHLRDAHYCAIALPEDTLEERRLLICGFVNNLIVMGYGLIYLANIFWHDSCV